MIKLTHSPRPLQLTEELQQQLTNEFKRDKKRAVWNKTYIKEALLNESNHKCAYCECFVGRGYKEMHVDHFHYKDKYEDEVVKWENLIPSCPHCNKSKSSHDTKLKPIINPFKNNPQDYFYIRDYRYCSINDSVDDIVKETIGVLGINDTDSVVKLRFEIGQALLDEIQNIYSFAKEHKDDLSTNTYNRNRVLRGCKNILKKCIKTSEFGAIMATSLQANDDYNRLSNLLKKIYLWDDELDNLDKESKSIAFKIQPDMV